MFKNNKFTALDDLDFDINKVDRVITDNTVADTNIETFILKNVNKLPYDSNIILNNSDIIIPDNAPTALNYNAVESGINIGQNVNSEFITNLSEGFGIISSQVVEVNQDEVLSLNKSYNKFWIIGGCIGLLGCGGLYYCYKNNYLSNFTNNIPEVTQTVITTIKKSTFLGITVGEKTTTVITEILSNE